MVPLNCVLSLENRDIFYLELKFWASKNHFWNEDDQRSGRSSTEEKIERVRSDRRLTLKMLNGQLNLNRFPVLQILSEQIVPTSLTI